MIVRLYWSSTYLQSLLELTSAHYVDVNPFYFQPLPKSMLSVKALGNGSFYNRKIGWRDQVTMSIGEDEYARTVEYQGQTFFVRELVFAWREADYMYIQADNVNNGYPLLVNFSGEYKDEPIEGNPEWLQTTYELVGDVFHIH